MKVKHYSLGPALLLLCFAWKGWVKKPKIESSAHGDEKAFCRTKYQKKSLHQGASSLAYVCVFIKYSYFNPLVRPSRRLNQKSMEVALYKYWELATDVCCCSLMWSVIIWSDCLDALHEGAEWKSQTLYMVFVAIDVCCCGGTAAGPWCWLCSCRH